MASVTLMGTVTGVLIRGRQEDQSQTQRVDLSIPQRDVGPRIKESGEPLEAKNGQGNIYPYSLQRECSLSNFFDFRTSELQNCNIIYLCHCKPLSLR